MATEDSGQGERWYKPVKTSKFKPPERLQCFRCEISVYHAEKVGPVNDVVFHQACFNCCMCGAHLTMSNYKTNPNDLQDQEIYCAGHAPKIEAKSTKRDSVDMQRALIAQQLKSLHKSGK